MLEKMILKSQFLPNHERNKMATQALVEVIIRDPANPSSFKRVCKDVSIPAAFSSLMTIYCAERGLEVKAQIPESAVIQMLDSIYEKIIKEND